MPIVNIKSDMDRIAQEVNAEREQISKAAARALNSASRGYITDAGRELRKRYPLLKLKDVRPLFVVTQFASKDVLQAVITVRGKALSLVRFVVGQNTKQGQGGVYVSVKGGRKFIPHAWVQTLKKKNGDDYQVIFIREGKNRLPIKVLKTINIPNALNVAEVYDVLEQQIYGRVNNEFERQLLIK
jgi:hypothetical protein